MSKDGILKFAVVILLAAATMASVAIACDADCDALTVCDMTNVPQNYTVVVAQGPCTLHLYGGLVTGPPPTTSIGCRATCDYCTNPTVATGALIGAIPQCENITPDVVFFGCCLDSIASSSVDAVKIQVKANQQFYLPGGNTSSPVSCSTAPCSGTDVTRTAVTSIGKRSFTLDSSTIKTYAVSKDEYDPSNPATFVMAICAGEKTLSATQTWVVFGAAQTWNLCPSEQINGCVADGLTAVCTR